MSVLKTVCDYVLLNPVRAGLIAPQAPVQSYAWSSFSQQASPRHSGADIRESAWAKAERIAQEGLASLGWTGEDLRGHRKGDERLDPRLYRTVS